MREVVRVLFDDQAIQRITDAVLALQSRESPSLPLLRKQLANTIKSIDNVLNAIQQGIFTSSTKGRLEALEDTKRETELQILQEELHRPLLTEEKIKFWLCKFREGDLKDQDHRQRLVGSFVNSIYLYDDRFVISFNYKDESRTVSLEEIQSSDIAANTLPRRKPCISRLSCFTKGSKTGQLQQQLQQSE